MELAEASKQATGWQPAPRTPQLSARPRKNAIVAKLERCKNADDPLWYLKRPAPSLYV